jgi:protein-tyrosine phosphatase
MCDYRFDVRPDVVRRRAEHLSALCAKFGFGLTVLPGGDVHLQPELPEILSRGDVLTLGDSGRYLLLELPSHTAPMIGTLLDVLRGQGVTPVLSHPERNSALCRNPRLLADFVAQGCLVQLTAGSLTGEFGRATRRAAEEFVRRGLVHVVATDAHSARPRRSPDLTRAADRLMALGGDGLLRRLLWTNPAAIVEGMDLEGPGMANALGGASASAGAVSSEHGDGCVSSRRE